MKLSLAKVHIAEQHNWAVLISNNKKVKRLHQPKNTEWHKRHYSCLLNLLRKYWTVCRYVCPSLCRMFINRTVKFQNVEVHIEMSTISTLIHFYKYTWTYIQKICMHPFACYVSYVIQNLAFLFNVTEHHSAQ